MSSYIDFINVGFGEATLIHLENEVQKSSLNILVDAGSDDLEIYAKDTRRISITKYLENHGIDSIDRMIITHFHRDHIGGFIEVLKTVKVHKVISHLSIPECFDSFICQMKWGSELESVRLYLKILSLIKNKNIAMEVISHDQTLRWGLFELKLIMPPKKAFEILLSKLPLQEEITRLLELLNDSYLRAKDSEKASLIHKNMIWVEKHMNPFSLGLLISKKEDQLCLITSDRHLHSLVNHNICKVKLLQAPHHGDQTYIDSKSYMSLDPQFFLISADSEGTYQLPSNNIREYISKLNKARVIYTESEVSRHSYIRFDLNKEVIDFMTNE